MADYPSHLARKRYLFDGTEVMIRPIRAEDAPLEQEFVRHLSDDSRYNRFMSELRELSPTKLKYFTQIDYDRHMAFVATVAHDGGELEIGVARYASGAAGGHLRVRRRRRRRLAGFRRRRPAHARAHGRGAGTRLPYHGRLRPGAEPQDAQVRAPTRLRGAPRSGCRRYPARGAAALTAACSRVATARDHRAAAGSRCRNFSISSASPGRPVSANS
ncbi:MAG: hypothetical protein MZW92_05710 [Comamonadaceae bacterium]|nr:hypothetical protein [Comamonadaceae bacterium]